MQQKYNWSDATIHMIDFGLFERAFSSKSKHEMTNIIKYIHGWQHTGYQKTQFCAKSKESKCSLCGAIEYQYHYHVCNHESF